MVSRSSVKIDNGWRSIGARCTAQSDGIGKLLIGF